MKCKATKCKAMKCKAMKCKATKFKAMKCKATKCKAMKFTVFKREMKVQERLSVLAATCAARQHLPLRTSAIHCADNGFRAFSMQPKRGVDQLKFSVN